MENDGKTSETMGVYGESTGAILRAIGRRLVEVTGEGAQGG